MKALELILIGVGAGALALVAKDLFTSSAKTEPSPTPLPRQLPIAYATGEGKVRREPTTSSEVTASLPKGTPVYLERTSPAPGWVMGHGSYKYLGLIQRDFDGYMSIDDVTYQKEEA